MSLLEKLKKSSTIKESSILEKSVFFEKKDVISTKVPVFNVALSGDLHGGFSGGSIVLSGKKSSFKTSFALMMIKSYLDMYSDAVVLFMDSEFGSPRKYFESFGIDLNRVIHTPITTIEELKFELVTQLNNVERGDRVIILIDSVGMLPSEKEVQNAEDGKSTADLTRNRELKSLFRLCNTKLAMKDIPMIVISHVYSTLEMFCLAGETKIKTADGLKNIKDINVGDFVYSLNGLNKVVTKYNPEDLPKENVKYMKLTFDDNTTVLCTDTHKFLMKNGLWVEAGNIKLGDEFK